MRILAVVFLLLVVTAGSVFAVLNATPVDLNYYFGIRQIPLSLVLVLALSAGAVFGVLASLGLVIRQKRENARLRKSIRLAEKEVTNLRNIPIKDGR